MQLRQDAVGEFDPQTGETFLILEQDSRRGKTVLCPFCGKFHYHGVGPGHRVAHCYYSEVTFTNSQRQTFSNQDGYIVKVKKEMKS